MEQKLNVFTVRTLGNHKKCWYCGADGETTADHFWPKSLGGRLKVRACAWCNRLKADRTPLEWITRIDYMLAKCKAGKGCKGKDFIHSVCPAGCKHRLKLLRMRLATLTLWERCEPV